MSDDGQPDIISTPGGGRNWLERWLNGERAPKLSADNDPVADPAPEPTVAFPARRTGRPFAWPKVPTLPALPVIHGLTPARFERAVWLTATVLTLAHVIPVLSVLARWFELEPSVGRGLAGLPWGYPFDLWTRTAPLRADAVWEQIAVGALVVGLCFHAARKAGINSRLAVEFLFCAAVLNALDWLMIGPNLARNPVLTEGEQGAVLAICVAEIVAAGLLWLALRRPSPNAALRAPSPSPSGRGPRDA